MLHAHGLHTYVCPSMSYHFHYCSLTDCSLALLRHPQPIKRPGISLCATPYSSSALRMWLILLVAAHSAHKSRTRYWPFLSKSAVDGGPMRNLQHSAFGLASDWCCLLQVRYLHNVGRDWELHMTLDIHFLQSPNAFDMEMIPSLLVSRSRKRPGDAAFQHMCPVTAH